MKKIYFFPSSVPQVQKKCRKNIPNENTKYICNYTYNNYSIIILSCIIGYCVISVSKGSNK